jgi:ketosteroid isomerase-like protein
MLPELNVRIVAVALALAGGLACPPAAPTQGDAGARPDAETSLEAKRVEDVLLASVRAFEVKDVPALTATFVQDDSMSVFENGEANHGWTDYRDRHLLPEVRELQSVRYGLGQLRVKVSGATAWATFTYELSARMKGRPVQGAGLGTAILEKRGGTWRIIHWHTSSPRKAAP